MAIKTLGRNSDDSFYKLGLEKGGLKLSGKPQTISKWVGSGYVKM